VGEEVREQQRQRTIRATHLLLTGVIAAAVLGFFVGIDYGVPRPESEAPSPVRVAPDPDVIPAMGYLEVRERDIGPNRNWRSDLARLPRPDADVDPGILIATLPTAEEKLASLAERAELRAYNGAPPVIPHSVDQLSSDSCLACHQSSVRVGDRASGVLPHPYLANCQQCHVQANPAGFDTFVLARNEFEGLPAPFEGARAWPGAPPVVPHSTFMRNNCNACHGPAGDPGLRSTHPWRQNCLQCHAPSAEMEQGVVAGGPEFLPAPRIENP